MAYNFVVYCSSCSQDFLASSFWLLCTLRLVRPGKEAIAHCHQSSCHQSAEALMLAMYPPNGSYTETLELHTMDETYDDTTANSKYVSGY